MADIRKEMNLVIQDLESKGIDVNSHKTTEGSNFGAEGEERRGLGDVVEDTLKKFGVTEERFKQWFNLKECGCSKRKKWLNGIFSWKANQK